MRITVLGGAGKMGSIAVQHLALDPRVDEVVIADINAEQAATIIEHLGSPKVSFRHVDLKDDEGFVNALRGSGACLNATVYYTNIPVMKACLRAGVSYVDLGGLFHTTREQLNLHDAYHSAGVSAVLGMGSAPGIPNVQARYAADRLDTIDSIRIYDGIKPPPKGSAWFSYAVPTIMDEMTLQPMVYREGQFIACEPLGEFEDYQFTAPIGTLPMHLSLHSEVATLPVSFADKGVKECFFKINHWGMAPDIVERIRVLEDFGLNRRDPVDVRGQPVVPRDLLLTLLSERVLPVTEFLAPPKNQPPDWVKEIVTEVRGTRKGTPVTYRLGTLTVKGALPTGVAPAVTAIWLAQGRIPPGVHPPELVLDPEPFFEELRGRDIVTYVGESTPL